MPRNLDRNTAVSVPSIREMQWLTRRLADIAVDELGIRVQGETLNVRPKPAHVVNWLLAWIGERPRAEQIRLMQEGRAIFDRHLASDTPVDFGLTVAEPDDDNGGEAEPEVPARKPRRRA